MMINYHLIQLFILNFSMNIELFTFFHLINLYTQYITLCDFISLSGMTMARLWLPLCPHACPGPWAQAHRVLPTSAEMLPNSLCYSQLKGVPATTWFLLSRAEPQPHSELWAAGLRPCCLWVFSLLASPIYRLHVSMHWFLRHVCAWNLLFNYSCSNWWNFKGRDQGDLSLCYFSDVMPWVTFNKRFSSTFS